MKNILIVLILLISTSCFAGNSHVRSNVLPASNNGYTLGSEALKFSEVHTTSLSVTNTISDFLYLSYSDIVDTATVSTGYTYVVDVASGNYKQYTVDISSCLIPINIPACTLSGMGTKLNSIEISYEVVTATCAVYFTLYKVDFTTAMAGSSLSSSATTYDFTYDTQHNTVAKRGTIGQHTCLLTIDTPAYTVNRRGYQLVMAINSQKNSSDVGTTFHYRGGIVFYTKKLY